MTTDPSVLPRFLAQTNTYVVGPITTGKTTFVRNLISPPADQAGNKPLMFGGITTDAPPAKPSVLYVVTAPQSAESWEEFAKHSDLEFYSVTNLESGERMFAKGTFKEHSIVVIDDSIAAWNRSSFTSALVHHVTVNTHHRSLYTFILSQKFFGGDRNMQTVRENMQNYVLFSGNSRAIRTSMSHILEDSETANLAFKVATSENYRPLVILLERPSSQHLLYAGLDGIIGTLEDGVVAPLRV